MRAVSEFIHVSGRFYRVGQPTGTQRSARRLLLATFPHLPAGRLIVHVPDANRSEVVKKGAETAVLPGQTGRWDHLWEQSVLPGRAAGGTVWTLMGTGPVLHPGSRHVMVVHDLNFMLLPKAYGRAFRTWYRVACAGAAKRADAIVCFTDYVRRSIHALLGVPLERITSIPQGPGLTGVQALREDAERGADRYFLCVGSLQPHKNLRSVLEAWRLFAGRNPGFRLKIVGRKQANFSRLVFDAALLEQPGIEFTGYIADAGLIALYQRAEAFLFPSFEEGFGLPVVEAFHCGCPVVTSDRSCLPEVAGGAAWLVDPARAGQLAEAMETLARRPDRRLELRRAGLERAGAFTWDNAGRKMAEVLLARSP